MRLRIVYCSNIKTNTFVVCQKYMYWYSCPYRYWYSCPYRYRYSCPYRHKYSCPYRSKKRYCEGKGSGTEAGTSPRKGTVKVKVQVLEHVKVQGKVL